MNVVWAYIAFDMGRCLIFVGFCLVIIIIIIQQQFDFNLLDYVFIVLIIIIIIKQRRKIVEKILYSFFTIDVII